MKKISEANVEDFLKIDGFDEETAGELKNRAKEFIQEEAEEISKKLKSLEFTKT